MLKAAGLSARQIGRIHGPIGLVPSLRDASLLAISILAEIVEAQAAMTVSRQSSTALILLAAGASSRFEAGDKLLAPLSGETVLTRAARLRAEVSHHRAIAICAPDQPKRQALLTELGWDIVINPDAALGQSTSLKCALNEVQADDAIDQVLILLGDMPNLPVAHLHKLLAAAEGADSHAVMSDVEGVLSPPAVFKRSTFADLAEITGDRGAKAVFKRLRSGAITLPLKASEAIDIDQVSDLQRALEMDHA
jgi:xanthine dehydrogenase accessory factor